MDQLVVHDEVAALRQRREKRQIGNESAAEEQRAFRPKESGGLRLQRLVLPVIAAQQPGCASADRHVALNRGACRVLQLTRRGEAEIVVGGEIGAWNAVSARRRPASREGLERPLMALTVHRSCSPEPVSSSSGLRPSLSKRPASLSSPGLSAVSSVSPTKIELAPAKKHSACVSSLICVRPADRRT